MKKPRRVVHRNDHSETYIETPLGLWEETLKEWQDDHSKPSPLPQNHRIFNHPEEYGCRRA